MMRYIFSGTVIRGAGYGKVLGFPTANIDRRQFSRLAEKPKPGVWAGLAKVSSKIYKAGIVVGPKDRAGRLKLEAYLIGFKGNLYGRRLELHLVKYLRAFKKFTGEPKLKLQISKDIKHIKQLKWKD